MVIKKFSVIQIEATFAVRTFLVIPDVSKGRNVVCMGIKPVLIALTMRMKILKIGSQQAPDPGKQHVVVSVFAGGWVDGHRGDWIAHDFSRLNNIQRFKGEGRFFIIWTDFGSGLEVDFKSFINRRVE